MVDGNCKSAILGCGSLYSHKPTKLAGPQLCQMSTNTADGTLQHWMAHHLVLIQEKRSTMKE